MILGYLAINQHGNLLRVKGMRPRKFLMDMAGVRSARKMYEDCKSGGVRHIGWIVAGEWWSVYQVHDLHGGKKEGA